MNRRVKRTLLDDLEKVYYSVLCENKDNSYCDGCRCCKNNQMCIMIGNLINSIRKHYICSTRNYYKKFL